MMNGKYIYKVLFSLFLLLPCESWAQEIVRCEYWFDGDITNKVENKMNGGEAINIVSKVPTAQLYDGIHQFNFRVMQSDGMYSPVLSRVFFKSAASSTELLEYWFDDNYENRASKELASADEEGTVAMSLDLSDNTKFPLGNHRLYLRVINSHGISAVYTSSVLKLQSGKIELLEYWVDGDNSKVDYVYGKTNGYDKDFLESLNLGEVSEGVHRLYYRGVSADGISSTAISSTPVMVKNRKNFDPDQQKVVSYSVAVDNGEPIVRNTIDPAKEITQPHTLKDLKLKEGNHKVTVKAWNTAGVGTSETKTFKVGKQQPPKLELTTTVESGIVFLDLNSIPGGQDYEIFRVESTRRSKEYIPIYKGQQAYPNYNISYDVPDEAGTHTYIGRCWYYDENRNKQTLESNEVKAYVEIANKDRDKLGYIFGEVLVPVNKLANIMLYDQNGNIIPNNYVGIDYETGTFKTSKFPVGTVLTLKVDNNNLLAQQYLFKNETVTINPGRNDVKITGMRVDGVQPDNYAVDLYFDSDVTWEPGQYYKFKLKNETMLPWKGLVRARIIRKSADNQSSPWFSSSDADKNQQYFYVEQGQDEWEVNESKEVTIPLTLLSIYKTEDYNVYFETLEAGSNEPKRIGVSSRIDYSNPHVYKLAKNNDDYKSDLKLAEEMADLALASMMLKSDYFDERLGNLMEFKDQVMKGIKNAQKELEYDEEEKQWIAQLDRALNSEAYPYNALMTMVDEHYRGDKPHEELKGLSLVISNELRKNPETLRLINEERTQMELALKEMLGNMYHVGAGVSKVYKAWSDVKDYYDKITKLFGEITEYNRMDSHTKFFYKTRIFIKAASEAIGWWSSDFAPFARVLQTYMDIAEKTVNYALDNDKYKYQFEEAWLLQNNHQDTDDYFWTYKNKLNVNFRVQIQSPLISEWTSSIEHMAFFDFTKEEAQRQVRDVNIILANNKDEEDKYDVIPCRPLWDSSGFYLMTGEYIPRGGIKNIGDPLTKFFMQIRWRNGRTSLIPLKESKGVSLNTVGGPCYTVTFESDACDANRMADVIYLVGDKDDIK